MDELNEILKNNNTDDLTWFCSLSESQLDLLISLKKLAIQGATLRRDEDLAQKFELKLLRALGMLVMEYARKRVEDDDSCLVPSVVHNQLKLFHYNNLLQTRIDDDSTIDIEEIISDICNLKSRRKYGKRRR